MRGTWERFERLLRGIAKGLKGSEEVLEGRGRDVKAGHYLRWACGGTGRSIAGEVNDAERF